MKEAAAKILAEAKTAYNKETTAEGKVLAKKRIAAARPAADAEIQANLAEIAEAKKVFIDGRYGGTDETDTAYRVTLLDKKILPIGLTRRGLYSARSTDVYGEPRFVEAAGGVKRLDYNATGDVIGENFIPLTGKFRVVKDPDFKGTVLVKSNSAFSAESLAIED